MKRYVRYVKCHALRHILANAPQLDICRLVAGRNQQTDYEKIDAGFPFVKAKERRIFDMNINYNSILHGPFPEDRMLELLDELKVEELAVADMDVVLPSKAARDVAREAAIIAEEDSLASIRDWVLGLKAWPLRREGEENDYTVAIRDYWQKNVYSAPGFEFASLDFDVMLPAKTWKEVHRAHGGLSKVYAEQLEKWKATRSNQLIRTAVQGVFPKPMTSGRQYELREGEKWVLTAHGDI